MELKFGLYEEIISDILNKEFQKADLTKLFIEKEKIDEEESPFLLSKYLNNIFQKALNNYKNNIPKQIEFTNKLIHFLKVETGDSEIEDYKVQVDAEMLLAILDKVNSGINFSEHSKVLRPVSPLAQSSLFTGTAKDPSLASELKKEILTADKIDMLVSFVKWSGIVVIEKELIEFTSRPNSKLRVLTTSYMKATDYKAVEFLSKLPNTEIKVSYDTNRTRLHAKAYLFHRDTGYTTAYIGSSNLSNPALTAGLEWNLKVTAKDSSHIVQKFEGTFETYWEDKEFALFNQEQKERLLLALNPEEKNETGLAFYANVQPYSFQEEILETLEAERTVHNRNRNLVVAATGTGKTVVSAFDYKRYCEKNPSAKNRLLFVAHRKEILEQSRDCFRTILRNRNFGDLIVGNHKSRNIDHLFVSIQSFNSKDLEEFTSSDFYDFIVVDEFHHAKAPTYKTLLDHYKPKVLLGLTATPERMDGKDVLEYFDGRIAAEIRLYEALNRKLLSPFQYFGVTDIINYTDAWQNGKYDDKILEEKYLGNNNRNELIIQSIDRYVRNINEIICVGFCVTVNHANYMSAYFNQRGLKSFALTGESSDAERDSVKQKLLSGEINFVFVVDIYNEGVDIPEIDTILFLRPTESLTVFIQQLGRGLRLSKLKECLTVLDFIGHSYKNYSFENRLKALIGKTQNSVQKELENDFPHLPAGCVIQLEKQAKEYVLENIKASLKGYKPQLINRIRTFVSDTGKELTLKNFIEHYHLGLDDIYSKLCWNRFLVEAGLRIDFVQPNEEQLTKGIRRLLHINSRRFISSLQSFLMNPNEKIDETTLTMLHHSLWFEGTNKVRFQSLEESMKNLFNNEIMVDELTKILKINFDNINFIDRKIELPLDCQLDLHCRYTRDEILVALGYNSFDRKKVQVSGSLYIENLQTDLLFVTLYKSDKVFSPSTFYEDYAISESLFHWQSSNTVSEKSPTGQRYINQRQKNNLILLFVRENKRENGMGSPYYFLGPVNYKNHSGNRPISITWELQYPMPAHLLKETIKLSI